MGCFKDCLFVLLNLLLTVSGFALIGIGAYIKQQLGKFSILFNSPYLHMLSIMLIIIGVTVITILLFSLSYCLLDCITEKESFITIYFTLLTLSTLMLSAMLVIIFVFNVRVLVITVQILLY